MANNDVPQLFGTDGVRGTAGRYPLDAATVRRLGAALVRAQQPARGATAPASASLKFLVGLIERILHTVGLKPQSGSFAHCLFETLLHVVHLLIEDGQFSSRGCYFGDVIAQQID